MLTPAQGILVEIPFLKHEKKIIADRPTVAKSGVRPSIFFIIFIHCCLKWISNRNIKNKVIPAPGTVAQRNLINYPTLPIGQIRFT